MISLDDDLLESARVFFPTAILWGLGAVGLLLVLDLFWGRLRKSPSIGTSEVVEARVGRRRSWVRAIGGLGYALLVAVIGVLATTSFVTILLHGSMHGWWLWVHVMSAGAFCGLLAFCSIAWAWTHRWTRASTVSEEVGCKSSPNFVARLSFWLLMVFGLATIGTMLVSMLPLFGTDELHELVTVHRYAGLAVVLAVVIHLYNWVFRSAN